MTKKINPTSNKEHKTWNKGIMIKSFIGISCGIIGLGVGLLLGIKSCTTQSKSTKYDVKDIPKLLENRILENIYEGNDILYSQQDWKIFLANHYTVQHYFDGGYLYQWKNYFDSGKFSLSSKNEYTIWNGASILHSNVMIDVINDFILDGNVEYYKNNYQYNNILNSQAFFDTTGVYMEVSLTGIFESSIWLITSSNSLAIETDADWYKLTFDSSSARTMFLLKSEFPNISYVPQ